MNDELKARLMELGLTEDQTNKLVEAGLTSEADMNLLDADRIEKITGCGTIVALRVDKAFNPPTTAIFAAPAGSTTGGDELPEGSNPTPTQINTYASQMGMDPTMLTMALMGGLVNGSGVDMDLSSMMPLPQIVGGYNPKLRNFSLLLMGQVEKRLGTPIVVINSDGSINHDLTVKYVMSLEEGFDPQDVYYDEDGAPYEIIRVGVDAQSIYDADPVDSSKALQKSGMGTGRIQWHGVPLEVRQIVFYAVRVGELNPNDETALARLRDKIGPTTTRLTLRGDFPKAIAEFNNGFRTGSLPMLRVQLSRGPRRREAMPRRRTATPSDLSGLPRTARVRGDGTGSAGTWDGDDSFR